jgi:hypothetical protein
MLLMMKGLAYQQDLYESIQMVVSLKLLAAVSMQRLQQPCSQSTACLQLQRKAPSSAEARAHSLSNYVRAQID